MSEGLKYDADKIRYDLFPLSVKQKIESFDVNFRVDKLTDIDMLKERLKKYVENSLFIEAVCLSISYAEFYFKVDKEQFFENLNHIYTHGAKKHGEQNWKKVRPKGRFFSAAMRHRNKIGTINEEDFGLDHLFYFCWNCVALIWFQEQSMED